MISHLVWGPNNVTVDPCLCWSLYLVVLRALKTPMLTVLWTPVMKPTPAHCGYLIQYA